MTSLLIRSLVASTLAIAMVAAHAATLLVPEQHSTVQAAIDAAQPGDTVLVSPGVYRESLQIEKPLTLRSTQGAETTTLDGGGSCTVVWVNGTGTEEVTISGFKITNSWGTPWEGVGLRCGYGGGLVLDGAVVTVSDNIITGNASCYGAGLSSNSLSFIHHNQIKDNLHPAECQGAGGGGGIYLNSGIDRARWSVISENVISGHRVPTIGGGIDVNGAKVRITGNVFRNNQAGDSGGAINVGGIVEISRNVIAGNSLTGPTSSGGGINVIVMDRAGRADITENVFEGNTASQASAAKLVGFYAENIRFSRNIVRGRTTAALVECDSLPYVIRHNRMNNPLGNEVGGTCIADNR
jgi:predicted outer membrane repeat protein